MRQHAASCPLPLPVPAGEPGEAAAKGAGEDSASLEAAGGSGAPGLGVLTPVWPFTSLRPWLRHFTSHVLVSFPVNGEWRGRDNNESFLGESQGSNN